MDTADDEEASSSWEALRSMFLPPDGASLPTTAAGTFPPAFALLVNGSALNAWVKQPSPSCAAAVVAGAWNALVCADGRRDARAVRTRDVLARMALGAESALARKKARCARALGATSESFDAFERAVLERIARDPSGQTLGGRSKADPPMRRAAVMRLVEETATRGGGGDDADFESARPATGASFSFAGTSSGTCAPRARCAFAAVAALLQEERDQSTVAEPEPEPEPEPENAPPRVADEGAVLIARRAKTTKTSARRTKEEAFSFSRRSRATPAFARLGPPSAAFLDARGGAPTSGRVAAVPKKGTPEDDETRPAAGTGTGTGTETEPALAFDVATDDAVRLSRRIPRARRADVVWEVFKARADLDKLRRDKPSTAAFGNGEVMRAFRSLVETRGEDTGDDSDDSSDGSGPSGREDVETTISGKEETFTARVAFGTRTATRARLEASISKNASSDATLEAARAADEWAKLRNLFAKPGTFLVSHHANHYAPVYALRERRDENAKTRDGVFGAEGESETREMLTARRGQRPAVWIPWEEARATMRRWSGYGIMAFERREA